jgi:hypothetical protein
MVSRTCAFAPRGPRPEYFPAVLLDPPDTPGQCRDDRILISVRRRAARWLDRARDSNAAAITPLLDANALVGRAPRIRPVYTRLIAGVRLWRRSRNGAVRSSDLCSGRLRPDIMRSATASPRLRRLRWTSPSTTTPLPRNRCCSRQANVLRMSRRRRRCQSAAVNGWLTTGSRAEHRRCRRKHNASWRRVPCCHSRIRAHARAGARLADVGKARCGTARRRPGEG